MQNADVHKGRVEALPVRWRVTTTAGVMFICRVEVDGPRIEVRLSTSEDDLVCAREVASIDAANGVAHAWLRAVVAGGTVEGLPAGARTLTVH
jgi:hypothetical protein